jgi:hypothetical protein
VELAQTPYLGPVGLVGKSLMARQIRGQPPMVMEQEAEAVYAAEAGELLLGEPEQLAVSSSQNMHNLF